ncbi:hypothetical protein FLI01_22870 [Salmonella enterica subsp. enterica serovar Bareilly]|uniref:Fimbrial protein n=1 Tax=Salmonella enterica subsp. enterica serovar Poona TaxID=436295 RepID=A0A5W6ZRY6_SALET|nr:hypothetical protein [Salmonella enterica]EBS1727161.1 hypothetical protein [Salmonella enterica subsp. enterica serovar Poona]EBX5888848.1 hypothetical protein [Salmonella enterica subsp. enterica serovar Reading]EBZ4888532.1 hypothetical protein [Salmonella enterica subsp. enterica serovar Bredeney]ECB6249829.1 hypothetical protein [Salmonella enterica subsp. enterica serovar London]ECD8052966.1 hypothetical protein [Salmonella enterica subsp. enterica serovar Bareilly]ECN9816954.1 hypot
MKKTLIALAVATSAVVSGSAMAWTANGTGGSVDLGGSLAPKDKVTPWEVMVGTAVADLDAQIQKGSANTEVTAKNPIVVLGIRTQANTAFKGQTGIAPQINYNGVVNVDAFNKGFAPVTLDIKDPTSGNKIGTMSASMFGGAEMSWKDTLGKGGEKGALYSSAAGKAFFGGLGKTKSSASNDPWTVANALSTEIVANYDDQSVPLYSGIYMEDNFNKPSIAYSAYYGAGFVSGSVMKITLDTPAAGDAPIAWKASLPVTVSYQ